MTFSWVFEKILEEEALKKLLIEMEEKRLFSPKDPRFREFEDLVELLPSTRETDLFEGANKWVIGNIQTYYS